MNNYHEDLKDKLDKFINNAERIEKVRKQFYKSTIYKQKIRHKRSVKLGIGLTDVNIYFKLYSQQIIISKYQKYS